MSRSGYSDNHENWSLIRWRGAVASAVRGRRGQTFLRELLAALDALPAPRLIANDLATPSGEVCAVGAVARARGLDVSQLDPEDHKTVAAAFDLADAMACEIFYLNDEASYRHETPEERFARVRAWVVENLKEPPDA